VSCTLSKTWGRIAALAAVLAVAASVSTGSASATVITVAIKNLVFAPVEISAKVGDSIEWTNGDFVAHTATDRGGAWNVMLAPGKSGSLLLKQAGTFEYFCRFHPNMKGRITVSAP
jgi:plastocyanin